MVVMETRSPLCTTIYTSILICIPALITSNLVIRVGYTILALLSVLHHAKFRGQYCGKKLVDRADKLLAHLLIAYTTILAFKTKQSFLTFVYWLSLLYAVYMFYVEKPYQMPSVQSDIVHSSLHLAGIIGLTCLLIARQELIKL